MARNDTGRWVARAAATGGGRTYRGQRPTKWYLSLALICLVGVATIWYSRYERQNTVASQPAVGQKWVAAFVFDICGTVEPNPAANPNLLATPIPGLTTQGDGLIHISPTTSADAGANATLGRFVTTYPGMGLTASSLRYPGTRTVTHGRTFTNGESCPVGTPDAGKAGQVTIQWYPTFTSKSPSTTSDGTSLRLANQQLITLAFVPSGASIPKPVKQIVPLLNAIQAINTAPSTTAPSVSIPATSTPSTSTPTVGPTTTAK